MTSAVPALDMKAVENWLYIVHGDCPGWSVVSSPLNWSGRAVEVADDGWPDKTLDYITQLDSKGAKGIYLRVTTVADAPAEHRRGSDGDSVALPALWLDMDIAGPGHKPIRANASNPNPLPLPPDEQTCRQIVVNAGLPAPTLWVHSGGGLYPWWFFSSPVKLLTPDDVENWTAYSARMHERVALSAREMGFHYGTGTHDMSRVLRIPGTVNRKVDGTPTQARLYTEFDRFGTGATFRADDLILPPVEQPTRVHIPVSPPTTIPTPSSPAGKMPGRDYNERGDVLSEVLLPAGWQVHSMRHGGEIYLTRPGKDRRDGHSASLNYEGSRNLYVWSSDAALPTDEPLSPFFLYTFYLHGGDFKASARELGGRGYGDVLERPAYQSGIPTELIPARSQPVSPAPAGVAGSLGGGGGGVPPVSGVPALPSEDGGGGLFSVDVTDDRQAYLQLVDVLGTGELDYLFSYSGALVSVDGLKREPYRNELITEVTGQYGMRGHLLRACSAYRYNDKGEMKRAQITATMAGTVMGTWHLGRNVRLLRGIYRQPIIRKDGTIFDTRGYDPQSQMAYIPDPHLTIPAVPQDPTGEEVTYARRVIDYMLCDFPWVSQEDKINYIGMLLTPMLTSIVDTPIKMGVISAHQPGSGKTLLANLLTHIHGGTTMPALKTGTDEEIRKLITSSLRLSGSPVAVWDNARGELDSPSLDALLTTRSWTDRMLGQNKTVTVPNDKMWVITGNNVTLGSDLTRRAVWACIDPNMPNPERRNNFAESNLEGWVQDNRGTILWALYTLIQAWSRAGQPRYCAQSDLFCGWVGVVNGIIRTAGWDGEFDALSSRQQGESATTSEYGPLFEHIWERFSDQEWTVSQLLELISNSSTVQAGRPWSVDVLPIDLLRDWQQGNSAVVGRTLGLRLKSIMGRYIEGLKVIKNPQRTARGFRWHLEKHVPKPSESPAEDSTESTPRAMPDRPPMAPGGSQGPSAIGHVGSPARQPSGPSVPDGLPRTSRPDQDEG